MIRIAINVVEISFENLYYVTIPVIENIYNDNNLGLFVENFELNLIRSDKNVIVCVEQHSNGLQACESRNS